MFRHSVGGYGHMMVRKDIDGANLAKDIRRMGGDDVVSGLTSDKDFKELLGDIYDMFLRIGFELSESTRWLDCDVNSTKLYGVNRDSLEFSCAVTGYDSSLKSELNKKVLSRLLGVVVEQDTLWATPVSLVFKGGLLILEVGLKA